MILATPIHCEFCVSKYTTSQPSTNQKVTRFMLKNICNKKYNYVFTRSPTLTNSTGLALLDYFILWYTHLLGRINLSSPAIKKKDRHFEKGGGSCKLSAFWVWLEVMTLHFDARATPIFFARSMMKTVIFCLIAVAGLQFCEAAECHGKVSSHNSIGEHSFAAINLIEIFSREPY